uniref:Uncharacterized protein n=1 Tax=Glossina brevipalpis TaxID=37001 RepID=A0A1A9WB51_9MUSC
MKEFLFIFFLTIVACITAEDDDWQPKTISDIKSIRNECLKEHPLSDEQITQMKNFDFPDEEAVRQYLLCTALKMDVFCKHQGYHPDRIAKQFKMDMNEEEVFEIAQKCQDTNPDNSPVDVWAFRGHKCMMTSAIGDKVKAFIKKRQEENAAKNA